MNVLPNVGRKDSAQSLENEVKARVLGAIRHVFNLKNFTQTLETLSLCHGGVAKKVPEKRYKFSTFPGAIAYLKSVVRDCQIRLLLQKHL